MIVEKLSCRTKAVLQTVSDLLIAVFLCILLYQSWRMIQVDGATEIETAEIGQGWFMAVLVAFPLLILSALIEVNIRRFRRNK